MEYIKSFKGADKKLVKRYLISAISSIILFLIVSFVLAGMPRYGYNHYYDRKIIICTILKYVLLFLIIIEIGFWITVKKNYINVYKDRIRVRATEFKWMYPYKNLEYELLFDDIQRISTMSIEGCKYIVIRADKEYKICLDEAEKCAEYLKRVKL